MVRVAAVVRDNKGRFVQDLKAKDFEVLDGGQARSITDFRTDLAGVSVAVLFDVSGSMEGQLPNAREAATHVLSWLDASATRRRSSPSTRVSTSVTPFTIGLKALPDVDGHRGAVRRDLAARRHRARRRSASAQREGRRRAVVVLTDGADNASRLTPAEVSGLASAIDVPVYIFGIVPSIDNPTEEASTKSVVRFGVRRSACRSRRLDRRTCVRGEHAGTAQHRGAADHRRAAASISDRI